MWQRLLLVVLEWAGGTAEWWRGEVWGVLRKLIRDAKGPVLTQLALCPEKQSTIWTR